MNYFETMGGDFGIAHLDTEASSDLAQVIGTEPGLARAYLSMHTDPQAAPETQRVAWLGTMADLGLLTPGQLAEVQPVFQHTGAAALLAAINTEQLRR